MFNLSYGLVVLMAGRPAGCEGKADPDPWPCSRGPSRGAGVINRSLHKPDPILKINFTFAVGQIEEITFNLRPVLSPLW